MGLFNKKTTEKTRPVPRHVGIILDGNGRWAQRRGLPRTAGHAAGSENFRRIATYCRDIGMDYLTVYAFSTENWKRSEEEIGAILGLLKKYLLEALEKMERDRIRLRFLGDLSRLPGELQELAARTGETSARYRGFQANVCLNYGGRDDIVRAARAFAAQCAAGERDPASLTEAAFSDLLYSAGLPDPDLIIRTSGELRLSNFLLWQAAYSEFYVTDTLWPDFTPEELERAIADFNGRSRRFGGVKP
ncbi:MAG: di-trans,poly-cis-decaprenylcistransferase [Oscillospiraceae bacterium]|nr:di-trans,poly-cis-decaprenylcistransferase [Oscillospiraceae bacterium]